MINESLSEELSNTSLAIDSDADFLLDIIKVMSDNSEYKDSKVEITQVPDELRKVQNGFDLRNFYHKNINNLKENPNLLKVFKNKVESMRKMAALDSNNGTELALLDMLSEAIKQLEGTEY